MLIAVEHGFARDVLVAAEATGLFGSIHCTTRGDAVAEVWAGVQRRQMPDVVLAESEACGGNGVELTGALRREAETQRIFIALVSTTGSEMEESPAETTDVDRLGAFAATVAEMVEVLRTIARRAITMGGMALS